MPFPTRTLAAIGVAALLGAAPLAHAGASAASVQITSFAVSASAGTLSWADPFQSYSATALEAGGLLGADTDAFELDDYGFAIAGASTAHAISAASSTQAQYFFATANASSSIGALTNPPNRAETLVGQAGTFALSGAGIVTFTIGYTLGVSAPGGNAISDYGSALLNFNLADTDGSSGGDLGASLQSFAQSSGVGSRTGTFTLSVDLAAGELGFYTLQGSALAIATAATPVPEVQTWLLLGFGLAGIAGLTRQRRAPRIG